MGVGQPTALARQGRFFQLADVLGVDEEIYRSLNVDKYWPEPTTQHFITDELSTIDFGETIVNTFPISQDVAVLRGEDGQVQLAANNCGAGRGVYLSGLPYSASNARLLERILFWAAGAEDRYAAWSRLEPKLRSGLLPGEQRVRRRKQHGQATDHGGCAAGR